MLGRFVKSNLAPGRYGGLMLGRFVKSNLAPGHQWHGWPAYTRSGKNKLALAVRGAYAWTFCEEQSGTRAVRGAYAWTFCEEQSGTQAPMASTSSIHPSCTLPIRSSPPHVPSILSQMPAFAVHSSYASVSSASCDLPLPPTSSPVAPSHYRSILSNARAN